MHRVHAFQQIPTLLVKIILFFLQQKTEVGFNTYEIWNISWQFYKDKTAKTVLVFRLTYLYQTLGKTITYILK